MFLCLYEKFMVNGVCMVKLKCCLVLFVMLFGLVMFLLYMSCIFVFVGSVCEYDSVSMCVVFFFSLK